MTSTSSPHRGIAALAGVAALAATIAAVAPGVASAADYVYKDAKVTFTTGEGSITATMTNPNTEGYCFLTIGIGTMYPAFGDSTEGGYTVAPGAERTSTHSGLEPGEYHVESWCIPSASFGSEDSYAKRDYRITVGPQPAASPFGSLGSIFGSLS